MKNIFYIILIIVITISCSETKQPSGNIIKKDIDSLILTQQQLQGVNVTFVKFEERNIKPTIHANGIVTLLPEGKAEVSSHINGKVERIFIREGMRVTKGQALLSISSFDLLELQNNYIEAQSDAGFKKVDFERQAELNKRKIGVLAEYQAAKAQYQSALAKELMLKEKLELIGIDTRTLVNTNNPTLHKSVVIHSPVNGYIQKFNEHIGSLVEPQTILAEIIDPDKLQAEVFIYEKDADMVKEGLPVDISFVKSNIPKTTGKILFVSSALDPENKTLTLHVQFDKPKGEIIQADMNIKAVITGIADKNTTLSLPSTTVYDNGDAKYVFVTSNPEANEVAMKRIRVTITDEDDDYVVIKPIGKLPKPCWFGNNNTLSLEAERKKNE